MAYDQWVDKIVPTNIAQHNTSQNTFRQINWAFTTVEVQAPRNKIKTKPYSPSKLG